MLRPVIELIVTVILSKLDIVAIFILVIDDVLNVLVLSGLLLLLFFHFLLLEVQGLLTHEYNCLHDIRCLWKQFLWWWHVTLESQRSKTNNEALDFKVTTHILNVRENEVEHLIHII